MKGETTAEEILRIKSEFYSALTNLSVQRVERLWRHDDDVVCICPGWDLFTGWLARFTGSQYGENKIQDYKYKDKNL
jgi:hypothetical protein